MSLIPAFDTLDKKPRINAVVTLLALACTLVVAAAAFEMPEGRHLSPTALTALAATLAVIFTCVVVALLRLLRGQLRYNPYSYNTIYYVGFALFFLSVALTHWVEAWGAAAHPDQFNALTLLSLFLGSAKTYMLLSTPFMVLFSCALCVSNVALIRHEGLRFVNVLGILLSFCLVGGIAFLWVADYYASGSVYQVMAHDLLVNLFAAVYLYVECMVIGSMVANAIVARHEPPKDRNYVIILGCGIRADGTPTPLLAGRCDRALEFDRSQQAAGGPALTFVTSGGKGSDEVVSESESMRRYLVEHGVEPGRIVMEDQSTNTRENMRFSKERIAEHAAPGTTPKVAFSTTNYHVFRSGLFARRVKMRAQGMGARTKWWFWPNAAVREFVGILTEHRGKQAAILVAMAAAYAALTVMLYL